MRRCFYVIKCDWMHVVSTGNILYGPLLGNVVEYSKYEIEVDMQFSQYWGSD